MFNISFGGHENRQTALVGGRQGGGYLPLGVITRVGAVALLFYLLYLGWDYIRPHRPEMGASQRQGIDELIDSVVQAAVARVPSGKVVTVLQLENDPSGYATQNIRRAMGSVGVVNLDDRTFAEKMRELAAMREPAYGDLNAAIAEGKRRGVDYVVYGSLIGRAMDNDMVSVGIKAFLADVAAGTTVSLRPEVALPTMAAKAVSNPPVGAVVVSTSASRIGGAGTYSSYPAWAIVVLLLPLFTIGFVRSTVQRESNLISAFTLSIYTLVAVGLFVLLNGVAFRSVASTAWFVLSLGAALVYNVAVMGRRRPHGTPNLKPLGQQGTGVGVMSDAGGELVEVRAVSLERRMGLFSRPRWPSVPQGARLYEVRQDNDRIALKMVDHLAQQSGPTTGAIAAIVHHESFAAEWAFSEVAKDGDGHAFDLTLRGICTINDAGLLLGKCVGDISAGARLTTTDLHGFLKTLLDFRVADQVRTEVQHHPLAQIIDQRLLPGAVWTGWINQWFKLVGVEIRLDEPKWESASRARALAEQKQRESEVQRQKEDAQRHEVRLARLKSASALRDKLLAIKHDGAVSASQREHEIEAARVARMTEMRVLDDRVNEVERKAELRRLEYERELNRLRQEALEEQTMSLHRVAQDRILKEAELTKTHEIAKQELEANRRELEANRELSNDRRAFELRQLVAREELETRQFRAAMEKIENESKVAEKQCEVALERLAMDRRAQELRGKQIEADTQRLVDEAEMRKRQSERYANRIAQDAAQTIHRVHSADPTERIQAVAVLAEEFGVPLEDLEDMGADVTAAGLTDWLERKQKQGGVKLAIQEVRTRDIGHKRINTLRIGSSLSFAFTPADDGYASVINIGTTGRIWLHVPNVYVPIENTKVVGRRLLTIPGHPLLPPDRLEYFEDGPAGWERLAVIVSRIPIIDVALATRSSADAPFVQLQDHDLRQMFARLEGLQPEDWSCAILSFRVE